MKTLRRQPLWAIILSALLPQPVLAFDSGVNAMDAATEMETQASIPQAAYQQFIEMMTGFRDMLDPILPRPVSSFDLLDAQIAAFISDGIREQYRIQQLIENIDNPQPEQPAPQETMIAKAEVPETITLNGVTYKAVDPMPKLEVLNEEGDLLNLDTSKGIDLPDLTLDPRDGGTYTSEIPLVDSALEVVQSLQDLVPAPIQTAGNELYDTITGLKGHDNP